MENLWMEKWKVHFPVNKYLIYTVLCYCESGQIKDGYAELIHQGLCPRTASGAVSRREAV